MNKYTSIVKESYNEKYPGTFKVKVPIDWNTSQPAVQVYNKDKTKYDLTFDNIESVLPRLSEFKGLIQISHVWFVSGRFGITIKLLQAISYPTESLTGLTVTDDSDDEESDKEEEESDKEEEEEVDVESESESEDEEE